VPVDLVGDVAKGAVQGDKANNMEDSQHHDNETSPVKPAVIGARTAI